jgi:antitoxin component YwqK of YwqJK toxin-antitoxin module
MKNINRGLGIVVFLLSISTIAFGQKKDSADVSKIGMKIAGNDLTHKKYYKGLDKNPYTGVMVERYPESKKIKRTVEIKDGIIVDGQVVELYESGGKKSEEYFLKGDRNGKYSEWYENGKLKMEGGYINDLEEGRWTYYKEDGKKDYFNYFKKGVIVTKKK